MSKDALLAQLFLDLKGSKKKSRDWITIAEHCEMAVAEFGSVKETASKLGVSYQLLRSVLSLKKLPVEVQEIVKRNEILFDAAQRINTIKSKEKQIEVANIVSGLPSHTQREVISQAARVPDSDLVDFRNRSVGVRVEAEKIHVVIIPLREELYQSLEAERAKIGRPLERIISDIISEWLAKKEG